MLDETPPDDEISSDFDEARLDHVNYQACALHLADLIRVYGAPPARKQPEAFGRRGPSLPPTQLPWRAVLATVHL